MLVFSELLMCVPKPRSSPEVSEVFYCWSRPGMANRERNKKMHAERGYIKMVVANVTDGTAEAVAHKPKADWLVLTQVRVRQSESGF